MAKRTNPRSRNSSEDVLLTGFYAARQWLLGPRQIAWRYKPNDRADWGDADYWEYAIGLEGDTEDDVVRALHEKYSDDWFPWTIERIFLLPRKVGETTYVDGPGSRSLQVKKTKAHTYFLKVGGQTRGRFGNKHQALEDIASFQETGSLPRESETWANPEGTNNIRVDAEHGRARGWLLDPDRRAWRYQPRDRSDWGDADYWRYALGVELDTKQDVEDALAERYSPDWWPWIIESMQPPSGWNTRRRPNMSRPKKNARTPLDNMAWSQDRTVRDIYGEIDDRPLDEIAESIMVVWHGEPEEYEGEDEPGWVDPTRQFEQPRATQYLTREQALDAVELANQIVNWANYADAYREYDNPPWEKGKKRRRNPAPTTASNPSTHEIARKLTL